MLGLRGFGFCVVVLWYGLFCGMMLFGQSGLTRVCTDWVWLDRDSGGVWLGKLEVPVGAECLNPTLTP